MRLVTYRQGRSSRLGALLGDWIVDLQRAGRVSLLASVQKRKAYMPADLLAFLQMGEPAWEAARQVLDFIAVGHQEDLARARVLIPLREVSLCAPVPKPGKIICIGMNYPNGKPDCTRPEYPVIFLKPASGLTGAESPVVIPPVTTDVAYEAELALVIGSKAKYIPEDRALECLAGYTIANDVGARDLEKRTSQWTSGKLMDTFCPLGPALVTPDEVPDPSHLEVLTLLNGQVVQRGNTGDMFFHIPELISYTSQLTTLEPGDLILTGSPKTIDGHPAPVLSLSPGDRIEITIGNLGTLCNPVVAEEHNGWKA